MPILYIIKMNPYIDKGFWEFACLFINDKAFFKIPRG